MINRNRITANNIHKWHASIRYMYSITTTQTVNPSTDIEAALPFEEIPGPRSLPIVGNIFRFIPGIGRYGNSSPHEMVKKLRADYGDMVRLQGLVGRRDSVLLFNAKLAERMYRTESRWPLRILSESLERHLEKTLSMEQRSLFTKVDEPWQDGRSRMNSYLMKSNSMNHHFKQIDEVSLDFIEEMRKMRDPMSLSMPPNFMHELKKWTLESSFNTVMNHRLGCFEPNLAADSDALRIIESMDRITKSIYEIDLVPSFAKLYESSKLKRFHHDLDIVLGMVHKHIRIGIQRIKNNPRSHEEEPGMLERILVEGEATADAMVQETLIGGLGPIPEAVGKLLFIIATHPEVQEKLTAEIDVALPEIDSPFTKDTAQKIPYLKACIKESLRLYPASFGTPRTAKEDMVLDGYRIPKGIDMIAMHAIMTENEEQFPQAQKFIPERWLRGHNATTCPKNKANSFAFIPFGFGPRSCVGQRFANTNMEIIVSRIVRRFHLDWNQGPIQIEQHLINEISSPLQLIVRDR